MEAARIEKEKEIARLRAQQERAKDKQAEKVNCTLLIVKKTVAKTAQKKIRQQQQCIYLRNGPDKNDSTERQRTCWNAKKVLTFLLSVLTSDWLKQQKLTKLYKAVHIVILTFQPSSV